MGLNLKKWLLEKLGGEEQRVTSAEITGEEFFDRSGSFSYLNVTSWTSKERTRPEVLFIASCEEIVRSAGYRSCV